MSLKNDLLRFLSSTGNTCGPTIDLLNIEPTPIDIYADYIADLESHRRLSGLAFLRVERIAFCRCSKPDNHQQEVSAVQDTRCRNCPHGPETLFVEVSGPNNFNYTSVLCMERKDGDDVMRMKRRRSSLTARVLGLGAQRGSTSNGSIQQATFVSRETMPTEEWPPNERETQNPGMQCDLPQCPASPNEH